MSRSEELFRQAVELIPGGVNSPVRAYGNVHETPRFIESAEGPYITDVDGNTYVDFIGSWGPMILGNNDKRILNSVTEPPIGSLITLIMEVATARANAIAANAICFAFSLLLLSFATQPIAQTILLTKKFIIFLSLFLNLLYLVKNIHIFTKSQAIKKRATVFYHLLPSNILSITVFIRTYRS